MRNAMIHEHGGKPELVCHKLTQTTNTKAAGIKRKGKKDQINDDY